MNNEIGFSETIIKETINGIPAIFDKISQIYKNHLNRNSFIHICYYETKINLNIIAAIKTKELRDYVSSPAFSTLVNSFQTKALSLLMIGDDRKNYNYLLLRLNENWKKPDELESEENKEELKNNENQKIENILDNFNFVIHKIEALKYISLIAEKGTEILKDFNFTSRINNIEKALFTLSNCLKDVIIEENKKILKIKNK